MENAINDIKSKVGRDWVTRTFDLDQAIEDNNVLSLTQKNDLKESINNSSSLISLLPSTPETKNIIGITEFK